MMRVILCFVIVCCVLVVESYQRYDSGKDWGSQATTTPATVYTKHRPGRRVCSTQQAVTRQEPTVVSYSQSTYKPYTERCQENQLCQGVRLVYETAYKTVYHTRTSRHASYACCPGWTQVAKVNHGCNQAQCRRPCQNGGSCVKPDTCACATGFSGNHCETDIDECERDKPCDQLCHNTAGSYRCECRKGFTLLGDSVSCRSEGGVASEARDLQGDFEILETRIVKLEKMMESSQAVKRPALVELRAESSSMSELSKKLDSSISALIRRLNLLERHQENLVKKSRCSDGELSPLKQKLLSLERRVDGCHCKYSYNNGIYS